MNKDTQIVITGTGATLPIELGFIPDFIEVTNTTTRTATLYTANDPVNTFGLAIAAAGTRATIGTAAAGIVVSTTEDDFRGFTLGAGAVTNAANVLLVRAGFYDYV